jgi:uncharacterized protein (DUF983 family)
MDELQAGRCPMCGASLDGATRKCLQCGEALPNESGPELNRKWVINIIAILIFIGFIWWLVTPRYRT